MVVILFRKRLLLFIIFTYRYEALGFAYATHGIKIDSPIFVVIWISFSFKIGGTGSRIPAKIEKRMEKPQSIAT